MYKGIGKVWVSGGGGSLYLTTQLPIVRQSTRVLGSGAKSVEVGTGLGRGGEEEDRGQEDGVVWAVGGECKYGVKGCEEVKLRKRF